MKNKQLKGGVVLSYISIIINILINLLYTPIMINKMGQNEYGLYTLVASVVSYLNLCTLGLGTSYLRFYSRQKNSDKQGKLTEARLNGMYVIIISILSGIALIIGIFMIINTKKILGTKLYNWELEKAQVLMAILVINVVVSFFSTIFDAFITSREKFIFQRLVRIIGILINPIIMIPLLIVGYKSITMVITTTIITVVSLAVNIFYCFKILKIDVAFDYFEKPLIKEMMGFSFFLFLNMIIDQANWNIDKFLLGRFCGTAVVATYGVAGMINSMYIQTSSAVSGVFAPRVNQIIASKEIKEANDLINKIFIKVERIQVMILGLIVSAFIIFGQKFVILWSGEANKNAYWVALVLIIPVTIPLTQNIGIEIQRARNKHKFRSIIYSIIAILNIIISIPLSKNYGAIGAATGTSISIIIGNIVIMNYYYHKYLDINIIAYFKNLLQLLAVMLIPGALGWFIIKCVSLDSICTYVIWICVYMICYAVSMYFIGMNKYERQLLLKS